MGIVPIGLHKSTTVASAVERLYTELTSCGFEVLIDDRNERPGVMFSEMDLMGFPHRLVIGERGLKSGTIEYRNRRSGVTDNYPLDEVVQALEALREL